MFTRVKTSPVITGLILTALFFAPPLQAQQSQTDGSKEQAVSIERIDNKYVCMVNDLYYQDIQIEVPVGEKTYYGCCQGCVTTLKMDPESRTATDPMTGAKVDKATAIVGALPDGSVRYFESEETLGQFRTRGKGRTDS